jgi:hypothetical protein
VSELLLRQLSVSSSHQVLFVADWIATIRQRCLGVLFLYFNADNYSCKRSNSWRLRYHRRQDCEGNFLRWCSETVTGRLSETTDEGVERILTTSKSLTYSLPCIGSSDIDHRHQLCD